MRRREKGLGYWLLHTPPGKQQGLGLTLLDRIRLWLVRTAPISRVESLDLDLGQVQPLESELLGDQSARVVDGLNALAVTAEASPSPGAEIESTSPEVPRIFDISLCNQTMSRDVPLLPPGGPAVRELKSQFRATVKGVAILPVGSKVRGLELHLSDDLAPVQTGQYWLYRQPIPVRTATPSISRAPHIRRSFDLENLSSKELQSYIQEAARLRGIRDVEILAVFRSVPIELMADYRFIKEKGLILYTLARADSVKQTRIHDLAVIADKSTSQTYLIAHPGRYRTAHFN